MPKRERSLGKGKGGAGLYAVLIEEFARGRYVAMRKHGPLICLTLMCAGAFVLMMAQALNHWQAGRWYLADVGNIWYCLVNTWHGKFMWSPLIAGNHFAYHFTPFFVLLLPLVWLSEYPIPLVAAYNLALALTPVPLYFLCHRQGLPWGLGLAAGVWFLGNHFVGSVQLSYHFESFYLLFALGAMALYEREKGWPFWLMLGLALSVKEDAAAWLLGWLLLETWLGDKGMRTRGLRGAGVCAIYGVVAFGVMKWAGRGQEGGASMYLERMGGLLPHIDTAWVLALLFGSTGGLALFGGRKALMVFLPMPVLLGLFFATRELLYYYSYPFLPFLAAATVSGVAVVWQWAGVRFGKAGVRWRSWGLGAILLGLGVWQYGLPTRTDGYQREMVPISGRHRLRLQVAREQLPTTAPVALQFGLWGVTPWREGAVFLKKKYLRDDQWVFADFRAPHGLVREEFVDVMQGLLREVDEGRRRVVYERYDLLVLGPAGKP